MRPQRRAKLAPTTLLQLFPFPFPFHFDFDFNPICCCFAARSLRQVALRLHSLQVLNDAFFGIDAGVKTRLAQLHR